MKIQVEKKDTKAKVTLEASNEELIKIKKKVLQNLAPSVKLAGFRSGKAPLEIIEKNIDQATLQTEFINEAINVMYVQALKEENIRPVSQPQVSVKKFVPYTVLEVELDVDVIGDLKLPNYKKITAKRAELKIGADEVKKVLEDLRNRAAEKKTVTRVAKMGDEVMIDFDGKDAKGKAIDGAQGKDYPLVLGSKSFIPGFEEEVVGLKKGDEKTFTITFPKDYGAKELQNKKVTFTINVNDVKESIKPKLDDTFAASVGPFKTLDQLKGDIKKQLEHDAKHRLESDYENAIVNELIEKTEVAIPESLIKEQEDLVLQDVRQNAISRGMTFEELLKTIGKDEETYKTEDIKPEAERRVKAGILLGEIADIEGIRASDEEIMARIDQYKKQYNDEKMHVELEKPENKREIAARIRTEKTLNFLKN